MKIPRKGSSAVRLAGYMLFGYGLWSMLEYFFLRIQYSMPMDRGIALGSGAIMFAGLAMLLVATSLRDLEQRLRRLENGQAAKNNDGA